MTALDDLEHAVREWNIATHGKMVHAKGTPTVVMSQEDFQAAFDEAKRRLANYTINIPYHLPASLYGFRVLISPDPAAEPSRFVFGMMV